MDYFIDVPNASSADLERFMRYVQKDVGGCWNWTGATRGKGYGAFWLGRTFNAHRVIFVWTYGEPHCYLHHICENRRCVNPEHLEPTAYEQPHHRGPWKNYCTHGHEFTEENTVINSRGERQCRECLRASSRRHKETNRERINARRREQRQHVVHASKRCERCGNEFVPIRSTKKYCSEKCQSTVNNRRQYAKRKGQ